MKSAIDSICLRNKRGGGCIFFDPDSAGGGICRYVIYRDVTGRYDKTGLFKPAGVYFCKKTDFQEVM